MKNIKKLMGDKKGFTIIELIVVVAIIAVLAAIVLVNVTSYINRGKDAAIKGNLSSLMTDAVVIFEAKGSYNSLGNTVCGGSKWSAVNSAINAAGGTGTCLDSSTAWCASSPMKVNSSNSFCVDSTGRKTEGSGATCASYVCP